MTDIPLAPSIAPAIEAFDRAMAKPLPADAGPVANELQDLTPYFEAMRDQVPGDFPDDLPVDPGPAEPSAGGGGEPPDDGEDFADLPEMSAEQLALLKRCAAEPANDIGNGRRLRHRFGQDLISIQRIGYYVWALTHWREDIEGSTTRPLAHRTIEAITLEPAVLEPTGAEIDAMAKGAAAKETLKDLRPIETKTEADKAAIAACEAAEDEGRDAYKKWQSRRTARRKFATTAGNSGKIEGMLKEAAPYISHAVGELDADPLDFNVQNGTIRFAAVDVEQLGDADPDAPAHGMVGMAGIRPHAREDMIAKLAPVWWCPGSPAPLFMAFLEQILPDREIRDFVQRYFGYALTALTGEQVFVIFHGEGSNGKSTLVDIVARVMGDYATTVPIATLVGDERRKGGEATPDLVRLPGSRLVTAAEPKEGLALDESLVKTLTGGDPILVRRLNQEFVEVYPLFKLIISCNRKPLIKGDDDGIWRRVMLVPFDVQIPKEQRDKKLKDKLWAERAGVLAWLVEGTRAFLSMGLCPPPAVMAATQEYRTESDPLGAFARQALDITKSTTDVVETGLLYRVYERWCERSAETPFRMGTFSKRMPRVAERMGFTKIKSSISAYQGIQVRPGFEPAAPSRTHGHD